MLVHRLLNCLLLTTVLCGFAIFPAPLAKAAPGDLDPSFGDGGKVTKKSYFQDTLANPMVLQPDGKIVTVTTVVPGNATSSLNLTRFDPDGKPDAAFGYAGSIGINDHDLVSLINGRAYGVALQNSGKIVVAGSFFNGTHTAPCLIRCDADGQPDPNFGNAGMAAFDVGNDAAHCSDIIVRSNDKIMVCGNASVGGVDGGFIARCQAEGALDTTFGTGGMVYLSAAVSRISLQADGKVLAAGTITENGREVIAVSRFRADGSLDASFGIDGRKVVSAGPGSNKVGGIALQADGKLVIAGTYSYQNRSQFALARLDADGGLDVSFGNAGLVITSVGSTSDYCTRVLVQHSGRIVAVGRTGNGSTSAVLVRYHSDGTLDSSFGDGGKVITDFYFTQTYCSALQVDDNIVISGFSYPWPASDPVITSLGGAVTDIGASGHTLALADLAVARFDGSVEAVASTGEVRDLTNTSTTLHGIANAADLAGSMQVFFELTTETGDPVSQPVTVAATLSAVSGNDDVPVSAAVTGLTPGAKYFFRLSGSTSGGLKRGALIPFTTLSNEAHLAELSLSQGALSPRFSRDVFSYTAEVPFMTPTLAVIPSAVQPHASITVNGTAVVPGYASEPIPLTVGTNLVTLIVAAQDGTQTYTITVTRAPSVQGELDYSFNGTGKAYFRSKANSTGNRGRAVAVQNDGKIVVAGDFYNGINHDFVVARSNTDGSPDASFGDLGVVVIDLYGYEDNVSSIVIQNDGKILVGGSTGVKSSPESAYGVLVRYNSDGSLDDSFGVGGKWLSADRIYVRAINGLALQSDGKIVAAVESGRSGVARWNANGSRDLSFKSNNFMTSVRSVAIQRDDKIVAVGSSYNVARFNADGTTDEPFNERQYTGVSFGGDQRYSCSLAVQADGKIVVGGYANRVSGGPCHFALARWNADGAADLTFGTDGKSLLDGENAMAAFSNAMALQTDGKILMTGYSTVKSNILQLLRSNVDGTLDAGFGISGKVMIDVEPGADYGYGLALQRDGKILIAESSLSAFGFSVLRCLNTLGSAMAPLPESDLGTTRVTLRGTVNANEIAGGSPVTVSFEYSTDGVHYISVAANPAVVTGSSDVPVSATLTGLTPGTTYHYRLRAVSGGQVNLSSDRTVATLSTEAALSGLTVSVGTLNSIVADDAVYYSVRVPYGTPSVKLIPTVTEEHAAIKVAGVACVSGAASGNLPLTTLSTAIPIVVTAQDGVTTQRYTVIVTQDPPAPGSLDTDFITSGWIDTAIHSDGKGQNFARQKDGKIVVVGASSHDIAIVRYKADGSFDDAFGSGGRVTTDIGGAEESPTAVLIQADGKILVAGSLVTPTRSDPDIFLVRYQADGSLDTAFGDGGKSRTNYGSAEFVAGVTVQADGKILVGGRCPEGFMIVRYLADGTLDMRLGYAGKITTSFAPEMVTNVAGMGVQADGKILLAGQVTHGASGGDFGLVRYKVDGSLDASFGTGGKVLTDFNGGDDGPSGLTLQADGRIVVVGSAHTVGNGYKHTAVARYKTDGSLDNSFGSGGKIVTPVGRDDTAAGVAVQGDGKIVVVGSAYMDSARNYDATLLRYSSAGILDSSFGTGGKATFNQTGASIESAYGVIILADGHIVVSASSLVGATENLLLLYCNGLSLSSALEVRSPSQAVLKAAQNITFGRVKMSESKSQTFTITNRGNYTMSPIVVDVEGANAAMFTVAVPPPLSLAPGAAATFALRYAPTTPAAHAAQVSVYSGSLEQVAFSFVVSGIGVEGPDLPLKTLAATPISFDSATLNGSVNPQGLNPELFFDYGLTTNYGSTTTAGTASGNAWTSASVSLTGLLPHTKYFYRLRAVSAQGVTNGAALTFITANRAPVASDDTAVVVPSSVIPLDILANDSDPDGDGVSLVSWDNIPATAGKLVKVNGSLSFTASLNFTGVSFNYTIKDSLGLPATGHVVLSKADASIRSAAVDWPAAGITYSVTVTTEANAQWSATESLPWVSVSGSSRTGSDTIPITLLPNTALTDRTGTVIIAGQEHKIIQRGVKRPTLPATFTPQPGMVGAYYVAAISITNFPVACTAAHLPPGLTINGNNGIISGVPTKGGKYNVSLRISNAAGAAANDLSFEIDIADLRPGLVGTFHGLVTPDQDVTGNRGARIELVTTGAGSYTGKLMTGGTSLPLKGMIETNIALPNEAHCQLAIPRFNADPLILDVTFDAAAETLTGTLNRINVGHTSVHGWRNPWRADHKASAYAGLYTFSLDQPQAGADLPQGHGFGSFKLANEATGTVAIAGKLADGSAFTTATFFGGEGQLLIYQPLYSNAGILAGAISVDLTAPVASTVGESLTWFKPEQPAGSKDAPYKAGFGPLTLGVEGSRYPVISPGAILMDAPNNEHNAEIEVEDSLPGLGFSVIFTLTNPSNNGLTNGVRIDPNLPPSFTNPHGLAIAAMNAATGAFSGTFNLNAKIPYQGQIVRRADGIRGYGFYLWPYSTVPDVKRSAGIRLQSH